MPSLYVNVYAMQITVCSTMHPRTQGWYDPWLNRGDKNLLYKRKEKVMLDVAVSYISSLYYSSILHKDGTSVSTASPFSKSIL